MTSILNWKIDEVMLNNDRSGKLMETFVFQELAAQVDLESKYSLYQYRDRDNIIKNKKPFTGIVLYSGDRTIKYSDNLLAVPTASLWTE